MSPVTEVFLRQVYFTGFQAALIVTVSGLLIGLIIVLQTTALTGAGSSNLVGKILLWLVLRELGPFFTGLIILLRSGSAIAAELATMKWNKEIEYLEAMGIKPEVYLIETRIYAVVLSMVVLGFYFQFTALFGGIFLASFISGLPFSDFSHAIISQLSLSDFAVSFSKSLIFGFIISLTSIWQGLSLEKSSTEIPQRVTKALTRSLFALFLLDVIINILAKILE